MEGVIVQRIDHVEGSLRCVDSNHEVVDGVRHRDIEGPVPIWDAENSSRCLVYAALAGWVGGSDLLGIAPKDLLPWASAVRR